MIGAFFDLLIGVLRYWGIGGFGYGGFGIQGFWHLGIGGLGNKGIGVFWGIKLSPNVFVCGSKAPVTPYQFDNLQG